MGGHVMRKSIFAGTVVVMSVVLMSEPAGAADVPAQSAPVPAYAAVPFFDWTGFYLGANGGSAGGRSHFNFDGAGLPSDKFKGTGWQAGGTSGFNAQLGLMVFGVESDLDWS